MFLNKNFVYFLVSRSLLLTCLEKAKSTPVQIVVRMLKNFLMNLEFRKRLPI